MGSQGIWREQKVEEEMFTVGLRSSRFPRGSGLPCALGRDLSSDFEAGRRSAGLRSSSLPRGGRFLRTLGANMASSESFRALDSAASLHSSAATGKLTAAVQCARHVGAVAATECAATAIAADATNIATIAAIAFTRDLTASVWWVPAAPAGAADVATIAADIALSAAVSTTGAVIFCPSTHIHIIVVVPFLTPGVNGTAKPLAKEKGIWTLPQVLDD